MSKTSDILIEIRQERERQYAKFGEQRHSPFVWLSILGEEKGEACQAANEAFFGGYNKSWSDYRAELIQVAAVAAAMIECLDTGVA